MNPLGGFRGRKRSGGAKEPVRDAVVPSASLNGMRPSENAEMPERAWETKSGECMAPGLLEHKYTHVHTSTHA
jgi:hypothetical protein